MISVNVKKPFRSRQIKRENLATVGDVSRTQTEDFGIEELDIRKNNKLEKSSKIRNQYRTQSR